VKASRRRHRHGDDGERRRAATEGVPLKTSERAAELAVEWIEAWVRMDMEWLRRNLAADFVHVSPFGRLEGRESYLATVEPMARKSVVELEVKEVIADGNQAAVRFENRTPKGVVESCDWVRIENDRIREIRSFYDSARIREVLSPAEQESLDG
jgi:ketosteroid isomerase-like protein